MVFKKHNVEEFPFVTKSHPMLLQVAEPPNPFYRLMMLSAEVAILSTLSQPLFLLQQAQEYSECMTRG